MISGYGSPPIDGPPDPEVAYWEVEAADYYRQHAASLGRDRLVWCPEGLEEASAGLLGDVRGLKVLEVGCGAAQGARWAASAGALAVGIDLSAGMLAVGRHLGTDGFALVQAEAAALPFADASFDLAFSAFGALPFVPSLAAVHREVARVLRPGGRWVFSTTHPFAWVFPDSPDPADLRVKRSYFERTAYYELHDAARLSYVEYHVTLGDQVRALIESGFTLDQLIEPQWPDADGATDGPAGPAGAGGAADGEWGAWSRARGALVPSTLVLCASLAGASGTSGANAAGRRRSQPRHA
ncbi:MAG: class I SAM-dependent methyltransferase [Bifidobacteriaceae bacterium]|jgi:ubiquinone/menaquinone biosynthesis C-methylase UbiE|nr:class I SAM-dependent methyltransferase [Bifidobacteriaceae bacterium]